jgi:flagellar hook-basal body complex protein FliE
MPVLRETISMSDPLGLINATGSAGLNRANPLGPLRTNQPGRAGPPGANDSSGVAGGASFKDMMLEQLKEVNNLEREATQAIEDFETGKRTDFESVAIAMRKAEVATQMLLQLRNKVMTAYDEVKQIRV